MLFLTLEMNLLLLNATFSDYSALVVVVGGETERNKTLVPDAAWCRTIF